MGKETGQDIAQNGNQDPDFTIPQAYYIGQNGQQKNVDWQIENGNTLKLDFSVSEDQYPIALDPTLHFSDPATITGGTNFGLSVVAGDFDYDGDTDIAVGKPSYYTSGWKGVVYIFYNDGSYPGSAASADVTITGETNDDEFGGALAAGDFDNDGDTDLAVGADTWTTSLGRVYIFKNDGSYPASASSAEVIISGSYSNVGIGRSLVAGNFDNDGDTDLAVGAIWGPSAHTAGGVYIFYNDGSYPGSADSADVIIDGYDSTHNSMSFGSALVGGDFNIDGRTDLAVGSPNYSISSYNYGNVYIFYNDGSYPSVASSADFQIIGNMSSYFGSALAAGDLNSDGRTDLVASGWYSGTFLFYNDGSYPGSASSADVTFSSDNSNPVVADFNGDGRADLAVIYSGNINLFFNNGSYGAADESISTSAADSLAVGDFSGDGNGIDIVAGMAIYIYYNLGNPDLYPGNAKVQGTVKFRGNIKIE
jgi:hypothetical protein